MISFWRSHFAVSLLQKAPLGAMSNSEIQHQNDSEASSRNQQETLRSGYVEVEG